MGGSDHGEIITFQMDKKSITKHEMKVRRKEVYLQVYLHIGHINETKKITSVKIDVLRSPAPLKVFSFLLKFCLL